MNSDKKFIEVTKQIDIHIDYHEVFGKILIDDIYSFESREIFDLKEYRTLYHRLLSWTTRALMKYNGGSKDNQIYSCYKLFTQKNHDYGEAWRDMRITSITDLVRQKFLRMEGIDRLDGKTFASEGIEANLQDIFNYCVFSIIKIEELS